MSDYTKITDFTSKDSAQALIQGVDFDNEYTAVSEMSTTKTDKAVPATANSVAGLASDGNLYDTQILVAAVQAALANQVKTATLQPYAGSSAPSGYVLADGTSYLTSTYPDLFGIVGYTYGGSGANFNVPDMRGRVPVGLDNMGGVSADRVTNAQGDSLGGSLGEENHTLTVSEMPSHDHGGTNTAGDHEHSGGASGDGNQGGGGIAVRDSVNTGTAGAHAHTIPAEGGGAAHNNMQPSLFINYIIKT